MTNKIEKLFGVNNIELNPVKGKLFIESGKDDGIKIDVDQNEVMHLLAKFTDKDVDVQKDIYGIGDIEGL